MTQTLDHESQPDDPGNPAVDTLVARQSKLSLVKHLPADNKLE